MSDLPISSRPINRPSLFDSYTQILEGVDPAQLRPIQDRLLIRDIPDEEFSRGGISLVAAPSMGGLGKNGRIRVGKVVARGDGDPYFTYVSGGKVRSKAWPCSFCCGFGNAPDLGRSKCPVCDGTTIGPRPPMLCQVGDRVVVDRRREGEIFLNRERYTLAHEYQSIYGVIHPGWRCIHCYCKNYSGQPCECGRKAGDPLTYDHPDSFEPAYDRILLAPVQSGTWKPGMPTPETMCPRCTFSTGGGPHLCRESDCPMRTKALIAAPENARPGQFREGIVRAVGCGARYADGKCYPPQVKPGDRVVFIGHYAPTESHHIAEEITLFGEDLLIMREKQILAVIGS